MAKAPGKSRRQGMVLKQLLNPFPDDSAAERSLIEPGAEARAGGLGGEPAGGGELGVGGCGAGCARGRAGGRCQVPRTATRPWAHERSTRSSSEGSWTARPPLRTVRKPSTTWGGSLAGSSCGCACLRVKPGGAVWRVCWPGWGWIRCGRTRSRVIEALQAGDQTAELVETLITGNVTAPILRERNIR